MLMLIIKSAAVIIAAYMPCAIAALKVAKHWAKKEQASA